MSASAPISSGSTAARNRSPSISPGRTTRRCSRPCSRGPMCSCRTSSPAPSPTRVSDRKTAPRASAPDHLLDLRLRRGRTLRRAQSLRHADPGRVRPRLDHRRPGRAGAGRRLGLRHRGRHERLRGDPRGADPARTDRRRRRDLDLHVRRHGGLDGDAAHPIRRRHAAETHRPRPHLDRALWRIQDQRKAPIFLFRSRATASGARWRRRCWTTRRSPPIPISPPTWSG